MMGVLYSSVCFRALGWRGCNWVLCGCRLYRIAWDLERSLRVLMDIAVGLPEKGSFWFEGQQFGSFECCQFRLAISIRGLLACNVSSCFLRSDHPHSSACCLLCIPHGHTPADGTVSVCGSASTSWLCLSCLYCACQTKVGCENDCNITVFTKFTDMYNIYYINHFLLYVCYYRAFQCDL